MAMKIVAMVVVVVVVLVKTLHPPAGSALVVLVVVGVLPCTLYTLPRRARVGFCEVTPRQWKRRSDDGRCG